MIIPGFIPSAVAAYVEPSLAIGCGILLRGSTSGFFKLKPAAASGSQEYTLPASDAVGVLNSDGAGVLSWAAGGGASGANPTGTIGLSAVNGVAATFLRSDGAPALSQAIAPTWTGLHTFQAQTSAQAAVFKAAAATPANIVEFQTNAGLVRGLVNSVGSFSNNGIGSGASNELFGADAGRSLTTGAYNSLFGSGAGYQLTSGAYNVGIGARCLGYGGAGVTGSYNFAMGYRGLYSVTSGYSNIAIGYGAVEAVTTAEENVGIGHNALIVCTARRNTAIGSYASYAVTTGTENVHVGYRLYSANVLTTGTNNTILGSNADVAANNSNYAVALGSGAIAASNECAFSPYVNVQTGYALSSTAAVRARADFTDSWVSDVDASRKARRVINVWDTAVREALRIEANGTAAMLGFFGHTAAVQPSAYAPTNVTTDRSFDADATTLAEVADVLGTLLVDLQSLGLVA